MKRVDFIKRATVATAIVAIVPSVIAVPARSLSTLRPKAILHVGDLVGIYPATGGEGRFDVVTSIKSREITFKSGFKTTLTQ